MKCKSSRFLEVDSGDGQKRQLAIPVKILRYLPFMSRIQRLYMTEKSTKQMTWHKYGCRYNPEKLVHLSEAYILEEVSNFTIKYYVDNLPSVNNPPPRYNAGEDKSNLSIFRGQLGSASGATNKTLKHE